MKRPRPSLKYVSVGDLEPPKNKTFEDSTVEDPAGEEVGKLEGFILDVSRVAPHSIVVNAGGWFRSKHVLAPIGHVQLNSDLRNLVVDLPKERIKRFPGFDLNLFATLTPDELDRMEEEMAQECCPDQVIETVEVWAHYRTPAWWNRA